MLKWIVDHDSSDVARPDEVPEGILATAAEVDKTYPAPTTVYNRHAVIEAADHSRDSGLWQTPFAPLEKVTCYLLLDTA